MMADAVLNYLLVEDDDSHAMIITRTIERDPLKCHVDRVSNGIDALSFLRRQGAYKNAIRPDVILLDLNLPRLDGQEVLAAIKQDPDLRTIPVLILSTSDAETDRARAYASCANGYLVKPASFDKLRDMVRAMNCFWGIWNRPHAPRG